MAIAYVRTSTTVNPALNTVAFDGTATDGYLTVQTLIQSGQTVTGVTYNGVAMTQLVSKASFANETIYLWGLAAPATGTNNIVVSTSGAGTLVVDAALYSGAQQTTAVEATSTNSGTSTTSASISVTTITDNDWLIGYFRGNGSGSFTAGSNTTVRTSSSEGTRQIADSGADQTPAGSFSLNVTMASQSWHALAFALKPVGYAPLTASVGTFTLTGNAIVLSKASLLTAQTGTFSLTGVTAALKKASLLTAATGSFALTGIAATLQKGYVMAATAATFTLTGVSATSTRALMMTAASGTFTLTGVATSYVRALITTLATGAFTLTGAAVTLTIRGYTRLTNIAKNSASLSNVSKHSTTLTNVDKLH